jgi:hypothetical protein
MVTDRNHHLAQRFFTINIILTKHSLNIFTVHWWKKIR